MVYGLHMQIFLPLGLILYLVGHLVLYACSGECILFTLSLYLSQK